MHQTAFVGTAHIHTPGFIKRLTERDDVRVTAVWDHDVARAAKDAGAVGAQVVGDLAAIWADAAIESVIVCAETNRHRDLVLAAAEAGKHLFVEKPLGLGASDAFEMAAAIEAAGVTFQTGYFMRSQPINRFLKEQITAGSFGPITRLRHSNCHHGSIGRWFDSGWLWMTDLAQAGVGAFGDLGTHALDIMMWFLGDVSSVTASLGTALANYGPDCDEFGEGLLQFSSGVLGSLAAGWVDVADPVTITLSGTEGHAYVANKQLYFKSAHVDGADGQEPWTALPDALPHAFELFFDKVVQGADVPLVTPWEAAARSAVMEALYAAARQGAWVAPAGRPASSRSTG